MYVKYQIEHIFYKVKYEQRQAGKQGNKNVRERRRDAERIDLQINNLTESLALEGGRGTLQLNTEAAGRFEIAPADRRQYCVAGEAILAVEVVE